MTGPHLTPEREAEMRAHQRLIEARSREGEWITYGYDPGTAIALAALDAERADHAQTRAVLTSLTTVSLEVLGSVRAVYGDTNQLVRDLDAQLQEAQRALGLVRPAPETT